MPSLLHPRIDFVPCPVTSQLLADKTDKEIDKYGRMSSLFGQKTRGERNKGRGEGREEDGSGR